MELGASSDGWCQGGGNWGTPLDLVAVTTMMHVMSSFLEASSSFLPRSSIFQAVMAPQLSFANW
jgi:hypothetical protein